MAQAVLGREVVAKRIAELKAPRERAVIISRERLLTRLGDMVEEQVAKVGKKQLTGEQLKAADQVARMAGYNEADKLHVVADTFSIIEEIRREARKP